MSSDKHPQVVLVTGAAGKTGQAILGALGPEDIAVRAFVRDAPQRRAVEARGVDQVAEGDLLDDKAVRAAVRGVDAIYHICPNVHPDERGIGRRVLEAAREAGVERFVFHSVLHPQTEAMPHHWAKMRVEEALLESGLGYTILQPAPYMQNILGQWERIAADGVFAVPYALTTRVGMVDLEEVAEVAARVLIEPGHAGATYELCGPDLLDQTELATLLGRRFGHEVRAETISVEDWARATGVRPESYRFSALTSMFRYYENHGLAGNPRVLEWLLDRPPGGFFDFAARHPVE